MSPIIFHPSHQMWQERKRHLISEANLSSKVMETIYEPQQPLIKFKPVHHAFFPELNHLIGFSVIKTHATSSNNICNFSIPGKPLTRKGIAYGLHLSNPPPCSASKEKGTFTVSFAQIASRLLRETVGGRKIQNEYASGGKWNTGVL